MAGLDAMVDGAEDDGAVEAPGLAVAPPPQAARVSGNAMAAASAAILAARLVEIIGFPSLKEYFFFLSGTRVCVVGNSAR